MGTLDLVLLIIFFGFVGAGFYLGLIHTLGAIIGVVVGIVAASNLYPEISTFVQFFMVKENVADVIAFIVVFVGISRLVGYMVHMIDQGFKLARLIPFATMVNRLAGGLLGFLEGALVLGTILYVITTFEFSPEVMQAIDNSAMATLFTTISKVLVPLIPESMTANIQNTIPTNYVN
ncbi:MAG: CvpA family protein [Candidatus Kerfeldbacteria bacterium]